MSNTYTLFHAASALEDITAEMTELYSLMQIYEEHMESELKGVNPKEAWPAQCFVDRIDLSKALFAAIMHKTGDIMDFSQEASNASYEADKANRDQQERREDSGNQSREGNSPEVHGLLLR